MTTSSDFDFSVDNVLAMAQKRVRLEDWGEDDFRLPLGQLVQSFEKEHGDKTDKKFSFAHVLVDLLSKRLYIQDNFNSYPEILDIQVRQPLFITGLPRTGTTLFHNLLSRNKYWRVLPYWELVFPYYRPEFGENFEKHAIRMAEQLIKGLYCRFPDLIQRHETKADGPEECVHLLRYTFYSNSFAVEWDLYQYLQWYSEQDLTPSYRYYKKLLQLLLWRKPADYLLSKCPAHLIGVKSIAGVFPDGKFIWMHRNPCKSIASALSLFSVFREIPVHLDNFIRLYLEYFKKSVDNMMELDNLHPERIKSVSYGKLVKNPVAVTREVYETFGYPLDNRHEENILTWLADNPQHKHGVHKYSLENFGLSETYIQNLFSRYYEKYGHLI